MSTAFDFHTLSLTIDHSLDEYQAARIPLLGLHLWEAVTGDRSKTLRFRHEHAHLTSFLATGLADLYGVFADYILTFLYAIFAKTTAASESELHLPLIGDQREEVITSSNKEIIERSWRQINLLRSYFFGFDSDYTLADLVDSAPQDAFWSIYLEDQFRPIVSRFYRLLIAMFPTRPADLDLKEYEATSPVTINGSKRALTARGVMEAYALTIEILNTYFRKAETDLTFYGSPIVRNPGPLYTTAVEYALEYAGLSPTTSLAAFLNGQATVDWYNVMAATSFAAMQVPVLQKLSGEVVFGGNLNTMCPAFRFQRMVDAMRRGAVPGFPHDLPRSTAGAELLAWLNSCHDAVEDPITRRIYDQVVQRFEHDEELRSMSPQSQSIIELSWAARANFIEAPGEFVLDAGLFAERYPCQARFIRTNDGKLVSFGSTEEIQTRYIAEHAVIILEAAAFDNHWDSNWAKLPEIDPQERAGLIANAYLYAWTLFRKPTEDRLPNLPPLVLDLG